MGVVVAYEVVDLGHQILRAAGGAPPDRPLGDDVDPDIHSVEPGGVARRIADVAARALLSFGHAGPSPRQAFGALMVGYAVNAFVPRGGEVVRALCLRRTAHTPLEAGLSSVFFERLLDLAFLALFMPFLFLLYRGRLVPLFPGFGTGILAIVLLSTTTLAAAYVLSNRIGENVGRARAFTARLRPEWEARAAGLCRTFLEGFAGFFRREERAAFAGLSGAMRFLYVLGVWSLMYSPPFFMR